MPGLGDAYEKYLETFDHWRLAGWRVTAADWRGQAGSGRLGRDEYTGYIEDFELWVVDLARFWSDWSVGREGALILVGHSMGGNLVMRAVAEKLLSPLPDGLILSTPMFGVAPERLPLSLQRCVARAMCKLGDPQRPAWKWKDGPAKVPGFRKGILTHDDARYQDELWWREHRPAIAMGPASWGWVAAALRSISVLERPGMLESVDIPVFLFGTSADKLVSFRAIERAARRLPQVETQFFGEEAAHEILRECDEVRDRALAGIDRFLDRLAQP